MLGRHPGSPVDRAWMLVLAAVLVAVPGIVPAIDLADAPPFLLRGVPPNLVLTLDDAGDTGFGYLPDDLPSADQPDILVTRRAASSDFNPLYYNPQIRYAPASNRSALPVQGSDGNATFTDAWRDVFFRDDCRVNLTQGYAAVWQETATPCSSGDETTNLYLIDPMNPGFDPTSIAPPADTAAVARTWAQQCLSDRRACPAYYYVFEPGDPGRLAEGCDGDEENDACYTRVLVGSSDDVARGAFAGAAAAEQNFANWFAYYRTRLRVEKTVLSRGIQSMNPNTRFSYQGLDASDQQLPDRLRGVLGGATVFYDWLFSRHPAGGKPLMQAAIHAGDFFTTDPPYLEDPTDSSSPLRACRNNFHLLVSDGAWDDSWAAPIPTAVASNRDAEIVALPENPFDVARYTPEAPYADHNAGFLADAAFYYWSQDLRPDLDNVVPPLTAHSADTSDVFWNPGNDPASWQHLSTYALGLGGSGTVAYPAGTYTEGGAHNSIFTDGFPGSYEATGSGAIPDSIKMDDLWHAAINGRGLFATALAPEQLTDALRAMLSAVASVGAASGSAASASAGTSADGPHVYQALLNSADWSGDVRAFDISLGLGQAPCPTVPAGDACGDALWAAAPLLDAQAAAGTRQVITLANGTGLAFKAANWDSLTDDEKRGLLGGVAPGAATAEQINEARARIDYLRGVRTYETSRRGPSDPYNFRDRSTVLGDIIGSGPVFVGPPNRFYMDNGYSQGDSETPGFKEEHRGRLGVVYVGANDGMLHAFNAQTGDEIFAYVPSLVFRNLADLTSPEYGGMVSHKDFVDGPIAEGDAFFGGAWHSLLVGALGHGAQGVYALDVTDPTTVSETTPGSLSLWVFSDGFDPDLGYVYGKPAIVRIPDPDGGPALRWVAIFGNGYNNTDTAGESPEGCADSDLSTPCTVSASGDAVLYVADIADGSILQKLDTGIGRADDPTTTVATEKRANGLAQVTVVDADGDLVADFAYAGDLFGNLWKFDLTDLSAPPKRIFVAKDASGNVQPITAPVAVVRHPTGVGTVVLFGTGKLLGHSDVTEMQTQTFYGIWDYGQATEAGPSRGDLQQQTFLGSATVRDVTGVAVSEARVTSANTVDWSSQKGWYIELCSTDSSGDCTAQTGERVTVAPQIQADRVTFVSLIPQSDPCSSGGTSWINALSTDDGSRPAATPFDFNGDGVFGSSDWVTVDVGAEHVTAAATSIRLLAAPGVYSAPAMPAVQGDVAAAVVSTSEGQLATLPQSSALEWTVWRESR